MKKTAWLFICIFVLFSLSNLVYAQSAAGMDQMRIGLGVAIGKEVMPIEESMILKMVDFPDIYVPIQVSPGFRLEPYFGYWRYSYSSENSSTYEQKYSIMDLGVGVFITTWCGPVDIYYGGRIGMQKNSQYYKSTYTYDSTTETTESKANQTNWIYGPAVGGEYFFTNNLSLGGEVQFNYMKMGEWKESNGEDHESDYKQSTSVLYTKVMITVRWFFGCR